jgi:hypothetical protein
MDARKNNNPLTEKEKKELELLDNPKEQRMGSISGIILPAVLLSLLDPLSNKAARKRKVVGLRVKMRAYELDLDVDNNWQEYYKTREEEEKRFDERFKHIF